MSDTSPLRRKIGTPRPEDVPPPLTPARLWSRAVSHGLTRAIGLETRIDDVDIATILPDQIAERIGDGALTAFLDGPQGYGIVVVSPGVAGAILETLTLGRVQSRPLAQRDMTATDTSMLADPIDRILATQQALTAELPMSAMASGYRFATRVDALREIAVTLNDDTHDLISVALTPAGQPTRSGTIMLALPRLPPPAALDAPRDWSDRIESRLLGAEVALRTELSRLSLTVDTLRALKPGDRLTLGRHAINNVRVLGPAGEELGIGRLGQSCGRKALRIGLTPDTFSAASPPKVAATLEPAPPPPVDPQGA